MRSVRLESSPLLLLLLLCNKHSDNKQLVPTLVFLLLCSSQFGGVDAADVSNCSNAPSFFPFRKGSLQLTCPKGWIQQGTSCFYLPPLNLTWDEAAPYCGQSENQASSPLTLNDLFITHDLAQALGSPNEFFWTGYYFDPSESQSSLLSFYSSQKISLYSPLWAPNQPNLTYYEQITSTNDTQCVAFNPNICNETNFGWYLQPCSWKRRSICQTVACFDDDYRCKDNSACIPKTAICDGVQNCEDSSDEEHCSQSSKACSGAGEQLNAASGEVTFLGAQLNQVGEATCEWTIKSLDDRSLMLNFFSSHGDKDDRIEVGEPSIQKPADAIPLGRSSSWSSSTNHSVIRVHTKAVEKLRLHFQYYQSDDPNCNAHITKWSGVLRTPSVNPDSRSPTSCKWTITNENNSPIMLKLDQFDLADGDKFTISDGGGKNGETIYDFTTKNRNPANVYISSKPVMVVMFKSIRSSTRRANVMANFVQSCTNQKIEGNYGQIVINSKSDQQCSLMFSPSTTATLYLEEKRITDKDSIKIEENGVTKSFEEVFRISKPVILHTFSKSAGFKATFSYSQDCKVPALPVDMNWISEDAVKQNIPYRKTVRLKCSSDDLTMTGKPELTCALNGMWDSPPPVCLSQAVPVCPVPYIRHGHVTELLGIHLGDFLSFACNSGFRASTSGTCACTADGWTPKPTCHKVECKKPDKRYGNATLENERDDDDYDIGSLVLYACNGDSFVDDSVVRVCLSNGTWSNPDFHCKYRGCYAESVPFGSFNQTFVQVGQDDPIVCDSGCEYTDRVPVCQKNGWMPNKPRCDFGHPCDHGDKCAHGICVPLLNDYVCQCVNGFKSTADFKGCEDINECAERIDLCDGTCTNTIGSYSCSCPAGKILYTGHAGRRKIYDKYLVPNRSCIEQRCEPPRINSSGTLEVISNGLFLSGSTVTYVCLNTNKNFTITCSSTGEWDKPNLKINCEDNDVFCRSITGPLLSVTPRRGSYEPGSVVSFSCRQKSKQKVVLIGPEQLFCSFSGTWIGEQPVCTIPSCQSLENFNGTNKMSIFRDPFSDLKPYSVGDVVTFRCDPGYELVGNNVIECRNWENPRWNGTTPCCKANGCEVATLVGNDLLPSNDAIAVGETVTFQCRQKNYILSGKACRSVLECQYVEEGDHYQSFTYLSVSDDMPRTCVSEVPHMLKRRYKKSDCLVPLSPEKYVMQNESFVLWCVVKRECRSNQVVWKRGNETLHTQKASNGDIFYFHTLRAQMTDQGSYSCSVEDDQETAVDSRTTDVFVNQLEETESGQNWIDTIDLAESNYHPVMNDLMERHWTGSDEWVQSEGRWKFFSSAAGKLKRLVTPAIVLRSDVVEVRFKILDESNAHFNISYAASNDPTTPSREDQFKLVTGIETTPQMEKSTRIQIEVPNAKYVWFRVSTTDAGSAKLSNFNVFYTFCPKVC
ncbi:hypothetical protein L596_005083 [Steinernema carpocapsae]|uniref:Uncharacterized protein n=1 Tax=Steinernema carpocapsae TaxID=34508 RepID=A0A4U8UXV9_STECR|nr:hypothetical protein L596_005083 [Steinernema carpocapsae]